MAARQLKSEGQVSVGAILCCVRAGDVEVLLLLQNNAFYNRAPDKEAVLDIGPKGMLKEEEDERTGALREIREETGLELKLNEDFREEYSYEFDDISRRTGELAHIKKKVVFFLAYVSDQDIEKIRLSEEHIGCRLARIDEAISETRHENQKRVLRVLGQYIKESNQ